MRLHVSFDLYLPEDTPEDQMHEWLMFRLGASSSIRAVNPLYNTPLEPVARSVEYEFR